MDFSKIHVGKTYSRKDLTTLWNYKGHQALSRGVITPANSKQIILFVTKEKQSSSTQYIDHISEDYLYWEGELSGINNNRIIEAAKNNDHIHLFYRARHHKDFEYMGEIVLIYYLPNTMGPYEFVFQRIYEIENSKDNHSLDLASMSLSGTTQKKSLQLSRIGQGIFRLNVIKLWSSCSITNINFPEILRASHIKPWRLSNDLERLDPYNGLLLTPTYDVLFDKGYITFENDGHIIISKKIKAIEKQLNVSTELKLTKIYDENIHYLKYHRDQIFDNS